jgi:hypothetical protein
LPYFFIYGKPVLCQTEITLPPPDRSFLQLLSEVLSTGLLNIVANRLINKAAAIPVLRHAVDQIERFLWERNIDALAHGGDASFHTSIVHTHRVYVKT